MAQNNVEILINLGGNVYKQTVALDAAMGKLSRSTGQTVTKFEKISDAAVGLNNIFQLASSTIGRISGAFDSCVQANQAQQEAETKLAQVMRNTMDASDSQIESIKALASAQQALGVVGDEIQLAGAQELGTYLEKTESLQKLIPVMNDMVAQQYGYNATQESAVNIATMMGKVMDGQVGALSRYGYKFDEAQEKILKYGTEAEKVATLAEVITESVGGINAALAQTPEGRMKQVANRVGDLQERVGQLYVRLQSAFAPVLDMAVGIGERIMAYVESKRSQLEAAVEAVNGFFMRLRDYISAHLGDIRNAIDALRPVVSGVFTVLQVAWSGVSAILKIALNLFFGIVNVVTSAAPVFIGLAAAIGILTAALKWQDIVLNILILKETLLTTVTNLWSAAQKILNIVLSANPIGLIIAAIAVLIGIIVLVCRKITGWGSLWDGVMGFIKNSAFAAIEGIKLYFSGMVNGIMIGLDKIKLGWYKFKEACGIGDSAENQAMIAQINADVEERQKAIIDGVKKVREYSDAALESVKGIKMGWKGKDESEKAQASIGTNAQLQKAVNGGNGGTVLAAAGSETSKSTEAVATGGTRKTDIHINLKSLVEQMNFNGTTAENIQEIKNNIAQAMLQALNMAQASVS